MDSDGESGSKIMMSNQNHKQNPWDKMTEMPMSVQATMLSIIPLMRTLLMKSTMKEESHITACLPLSLSHLLTSLSSSSSLLLALLILRFHTREFHYSIFISWILWQPTSFMLTHSFIFQRQLTILQKH